MNNNLWDFIGLADKETFLTGVIGWLLNPNADHGLGNLFLKEILNGVGLELEPDLIVEVEKMIKKRRRLDISLNSNGQPRVAFEVKCKTYGSADQLYRYAESVPFVVRIGFGEWNYPDLSEKEREQFPLIRFKEMAKILEKSAISVTRYSDLIGSLVGHLNKESKLFDDVYNYYIEEINDKPIVGFNFSNQRFLNLLYWRWFIEKFDKDYPNIDWKWRKKSMTSGVHCITQAEEFSENGELYLKSFDLKLSGPFKAWVHLELNNKASLVGNDDGIVGKIQFRVTGRDDLNTIHDEFKKHEDLIIQRGYYVAMKKPGTSNYYNAITKKLSRKEMRYSSIVNIINRDFKEML